MVTIQSLRKRCQPNQGRSWSEVINRRISIYITRMLITLPVSANHVTLASIGLTFLAATTFVLFYDLKYWLLGILLYQFAYTLDYVDGEIARYKGTSSLSGLFFDRVASTINETILFIGIFWSLFIRSHEEWILLLGIGTILGVLFPRVCMGSAYQSALEAILQTSNVAGTKMVDIRSESAITSLTLDSIGSEGGFARRYVWFMLGEGKILFLTFSVICDFFFFDLGETGCNVFFLGLFLFYYGIIMPLAGFIFCASIIRDSKTESLYSQVIDIKKEAG